jgi:hypothetical protein
LLLVPSRLLFLCYLLRVYYLLLTNLLAKECNMAHNSKTVLQNSYHIQKINFTRRHVFIALIYYYYYYYYYYYFITNSTEPSPF